MQCGIILNSIERRNKENYELNLLRYEQIEKIKKRIEYMENLIKIIDKRALTITLILCLLLNITGIANKYFYPEAYSIETVGPIKIAHFFFLYIIIHRICVLYKNRKTEKGRCEIAYSLIYFTILMVVLVLIWPGAWSWDDIEILGNAKAYKFTPWQHFFSGLFHVLSLQTIPIASGILIIQVLIVSLIVGYCLSNISALFGKSKKQKNIIRIGMLLITLFPPILLYTLSGFRMGLYSYMELLLVCMMIILYKEKKEIKPIDIFSLGAIAIIVSSWRTEGIYYPFFLFILFCILKKKPINKRVAAAICIAICAASVGIAKYNNEQIKNNNYSVTATLEPVTSIVKIANEEDKELIKIIDKVINVDYVIENPQMTGETYYWTKGFMRNYTPENYTDYLKAYVKLAIKYPNVTLRSMWTIFKQAVSGIGEDNKQTTFNMIYNGRIIDIFEEGNISYIKWQSNKSWFKEPINLNIRKSVLQLLGGIDANFNLTIIHNIFWNLFIPLAFISICFIYKLIRKDWYMVFLILMVIARVPLVFATAPAPYFMYYLSTYLCSYVLSFIIIFEWIDNIKQKSITSITKNENEKVSNKEKVKMILKQFVSFLLVSGIGWLIDFTIYFVLTRIANLKVLLANIISSIPAITYVFLMSNKKIFKNNNSKISLKTKYLIYFVYQLVLLLTISGLGEFLYNKLINAVTIAFLLDNLKIIIKILITPITMTINFIVVKNLIEKL